MIGLCELQIKDRYHFGLLLKEANSVPVHGVIHKVRTQLGGEGSIHKCIGACMREGGDQVDKYTFSLFIMQFVRSLKLKNVEGIHQEVCASIVIN